MGCKLVDCKVIQKNQVLVFPIITTISSKLIELPILIRNNIYSPASGTTPDFVADTAKSGGSSAAKYVTKPINLTNNSTALDIRLSAYVPSTSEIEMYLLRKE